MPWEKTMLHMVGLAVCYPAVSLLPDISLLLANVNTKRLPEVLALTTRTTILR